MDRNEEIVKMVLGRPRELVRITFSGKNEGSLPWIKVVVRPVEVQKEIMWQFSYYDEKKDITKNFDIDQYFEKVEELKKADFANVNIETIKENIAVTKSKSGKKLYSFKRKKEIVGDIDLSHDHIKNNILNAVKDARFLEKIEITNIKGNIKNKKKFHQLNEFLKLIEETVDEKYIEETETINIVDCGCGNAYLTFTLYYYFSIILKKSVKIVGVDVNEELLERHKITAKELGFENIVFEKSKIIDYKVDFKPDIVVVLHACDTATDEALAQAISWQCQYIFSVPCCHHNIQAQIEKSEVMHGVLKPILSQPILRERFGDLLTDSMRVLQLKIAGYKTDIVQFIDAEHTAKNLMIRATKVGRLTNHEELESEFEELKKFSGVAPVLENYCER